jgi:FkbM family methyltransferase
MSRGTDDVILDIGSGIGEFTVWCCDAGARVLAFEPDPLA